MTESERF